jgi:hypothetical protein
MSQEQTNKELTELLDFVQNVSNKCDATMDKARQVIRLQDELRDLLLLRIDRLERECKSNIILGILLGIGLAGIILLSTLIF